MIPTLAHSQPCWVTSSHAALRSIDKATSQPLRRARMLAVFAGSHCQIV